MYAVISDVHSNLHALEAVIGDIEGRKINDIYFAGDAVGYGPKPDRCLEIIKKYCKICIAGNHDWAVIGYTDINYFNEYAREAIFWTKNNISDDHMSDLEGYNIIKSSKEYDALFVHATPKDPELWNYIFSLYDAEIHFNYFNQPICFIGHSHNPVVMERLHSGELLLHRNNVKIKPQSKYIVNVGSVGQPRDGDPRASYAIIKGNSIEIVRVEYDIKKTQEEMKEAALPEKLIERLSYGF